MTTSKPFGYFGGKHILAPFLDTLLPPHDCYVEVFGGSGALLFHKKPSRVEVFNDLDTGIINFFKVLRDPVKSQELQRLLHLTPFARDEYYEAWDTWQQIDDPVEMARRFFVVARQGFSGRGKHGSWGYSRQRNHASTFQVSIGMFPDFCERLQRVQIDHADFQTVLEAYDGPDTCFYLDPPYLRDTRREKVVYRHEMSKNDHIRLLECVQSIHGMVILSGYNSPLYHDALKGWQCLKKEVSCSSAGRTRASGLQGEGSITGKQMRTEYIWSNPAAMRRRATLFDEVS